MSQPLIFSTVATHMGTFGVHTEPKNGSWSTHVTSPTFSDAMGTHEAGHAATPDLARAVHDYAVERIVAVIDPDAVINHHPAPPIP